jgi:signal transduction histidine kinase
MTAGSISPRWVPVAVYCTVLAAGLYSSAMGLDGAVQGSQVAGFVVVIAVLLAIEAAEWRWLTLPLPRWQMLALLAVRLGLFVAAAALDPSGEFWVLFILVPFAAYFVLGRTVSLVLGGVCLTFVLAGFTLAVPHWYTQPTYLSDVLMFSVGLVLAIAMAGTAIGEQAGRIRLEAVLRDLRASHDRLTAYAGQVADLSAEAERNRLARDIHDSLGHHLTAIAVQLEKAQAFRGRDGSAADQAVADARGLARQALQDVRGSVAALRGDEPSAPLSALLASLVHQAGPGEPLVTLTVAGDEASVGPAARTVLFRTAQEALTNARRHSGAGQVQVSVTVDEGETRLVVADNGRGFDPSRCGSPTGRAAQEGLGGFGLLSIRERAALAGGRAEITSQPGAGTTVTVSVPASVTASGVPA